MTTPRAERTIISPDQAPPPVEPPDSATLCAALSRHVGDHESVERLLGLPKRRYYLPWDTSTTYGVNRILNAYCDLHFLGDWPLSGCWSHGWMPSFALCHPYQVAHLTKPGEFPRNFVPRADMVAMLQLHGYGDVRAVGLPFVYLPETTVPRLPQSVLVAPAHSEPDLLQRRTDLPKLADVLGELKQRFQLVVGCVHSQCLRNGLWLEDFRRAGIPYVSGANMRDANTLYRMRHLFSQFQVVVTNGFGSLIAYASACGAAVVLSGDYVEESRAQMLTDTFYAAHPEVADSALESLSEKSLRQHCPFLWTPPQYASPQVEWARRELGWDRRLAPAEAIEVFGLRPSVRLSNAIRRLGRKIRYAVHRRFFRLTHE